MKLVDAQLIQSDPRLLSGVNATNKQNRDNKGHGVNSSPKLIPLFLFFLLYVICLLGAASGLGGGLDRAGGRRDRLGTNNSFANTVGAERAGAELL